MLSTDNVVFLQELNRQLDERPIIEEQFREWVEEVHKMGTEFPLMFPDRDDVIMPQWAVKVGISHLSADLSKLKLVHSSDVWHIAAFQMQLLNQ